jgi:hypothetical protein
MLRHQVDINAISISVSKNPLIAGPQGKIEAHREMGPGVGHTPDPPEFRLHSVTVSLSPKWDWDGRNVSPFFSLTLFAQEVSCVSTANANEIRLIGHITYACGGYPARRVQWRTGGVVRLATPPGSWRRCDPAIFIVVGGEGVLVAGAVISGILGMRTARGKGAAMFVCFARYF